MVRGAIHGIASTIGALAKGIWLVLRTLWKGSAGKVALILAAAVLWLSLSGISGSARELLGLLLILTVFILIARILLRGGR